MAKKSRDISTTADGEDDLADVTPQELEGTPANAAHTSSETFRQDVHQQPVVRVDEDLGIGPRTPYPTGHGPDEREVFHSIHGYYKPEENEATPNESKRP